MRAWGRYFSRNAETGVKRPGAELYLDDPAQKLPLLALQKAAPEAAQELHRQAEENERRLGQAVQTHFRLEDGQLALEPFQPLACSRLAALKIAIQLVAEGLLRQEDALRQADPETLRQMLLPRLKGSQAPLCIGQGNGWGACCGQVARDGADCLRLRGQGLPVILVCAKLDESHRDCLDLIQGALVSDGSTLALDQVQKPCVVVAPAELAVGDWIALDSLSGQVFSGAMPLQPGQLNADAALLLGWADRHRKIDLRANVSTASELEQALAWGASGVGLFRLDALLLGSGRLALFQTCLRQICCEGRSDSPELTELTEQLALDCQALFLTAGPIRFTLRLLDAPVSLMLRYWKEAGTLPDAYWSEPLSSWLLELNPTQALRCGRVGLVFPALFELQMRACLRACQKQPVQLQLMVPGVCDVRELELARALCGQICQREGLEMPQLGCMLELPRACLTAGRLSEQADFLSFGTGDLTESTCGISRYDAALSFLPGYLEQGILARDPFQAIDRAGVGELMRIARSQVRRPAELGTCGAQAADPASLQFCCELGLDFVSVAVRHLAVARLAAAQASWQ